MKKFIAVIALVAVLFGGTLVVNNHSSQNASGTVTAQPASSDPGTGGS